MPKLVVGRQGLVRHYRGTVFALHEGHRLNTYELFLRKSSPAYTYARSTNQARHFLNERYPHPPYIITDVKEAG